jgi:hypothetical protein
MSFSISISGHSGEKHNAEVNEAFTAAVTALNKIPGVTGTASGYSNDGESITFSTNLGVDANTATPESSPTEEAPSA